MTWVLYSTFNLPDTNRRSIEGVINAQYLGDITDGSLPGITGTLNWQGVQSPSTTGAFSHTTGASAGVGYGYTQYFMYADFNASRSSSAYSRSDNEVHPRSIGLFYIIKY